MYNHHNVYYNHDLDELGDDGDAANQSSRKNTWQTPTVIHCEIL